jgi:glycolate oxidase iron-sulfur subunit
MKPTTSLHTALDVETDKLLGCIHCGLCLPACPTYLQLGNENDSPRGRIYLMRAVAEGRLDVASQSFSRHIDLCLGCRACETACPAGVRYGFLLEAARESILEHETGMRAGFQKTILKLALRHIFPRRDRLKTAFAFSRWLRANGLIKFLFEKGFIQKLSSRADFALSLLMTTNPVDHVSKGPQNDLSVAPTGRNDASRPIAVFTGCVMEGLFKHTNDATKRVLAVNDCQLHEVRTQACCGALHAHAGDIETARELARRNINAFERFLSDHGDAHNPPIIIINAAGCGALLKEYGELLKDDHRYARRARRFSEHVRDVTEFLAGGGIRPGAEINRRVTYDAPCHLYHAQRITTAPQQILTAIPGLEYVQLDGMQDCCGGAGIYNLSEPEMSEGLLSDKINKVKATDADILATANPGCQMQLGAGVRMFKADCRVTHIIELLDESYRRAGFYKNENAKHAN